ncbi:MAG: Rieske iron-sulfur protein [Paenibacillaceae bacterium]|jgi:nitrite reductase/ring-hydroxylating ferredoxin subunit|nr:Rieske iron-sulfur protein [Paenibacillaceae bacterium]
MERYPVAGIDELSDGDHKIIEVRGLQFGLYRINGQYYAWRNVCPHQGAPVCQGKVCGTSLPSMVYEYKYGRENEILRCPWHGWEFDLLNGEHLVDPDTKLKQGKLAIGNRNNENLEPGLLETDQELIYLLL